MRIGRRHFLKTSVLSGISAAVYPTFSAGAFNRERDRMDDILIEPTFPQMEWQDSEIGVIFHFDISIASGHFRRNNMGRKVFDPQSYNPERLDTDQWVRAAKASGAKYAVFTATHFCGFMQWQSDLYPYGLKQAKWRNGQGDIVADFVKSCYKYGLRPGIYFSTNRNAYWQVDQHYVDWGKGKGSVKQQQFNEICVKMMEELCGRYGSLLELWFDAGNKTPEQGGSNMLPSFEKLQPNGLFYSSFNRADFRWVGNEDGYADYPCWATMPEGRYSHNSPSWKNILDSGDPNGGIWSPAMVDFPLRGAHGTHDWFWHPNHEKGIYSVDKLMKMYRQSVGRNSNMVLGVVIDPEGLVPQADAQRLAEFGQSLQKQFNNPIGSAKGTGKEFIIDLKVSSSLKQYVIQEDIQFGERTRSYLIKGRLKNGNWVDIDKGTCIGHKRIASIDQSKTFSRVALHITESTGEPHIREFVVF